MTKLCSTFMLPAFALLFTGCQTATDMMFEPDPNDPLDGYEGSLAQAGINTDMDLGPKQTYLLSEFQTVKRENAQLKQDNEQLLSQLQNLQAKLTDEQNSLEAEQKSRAQAEAEADQYRRRVRERDAKILSLSIANAKLEQDRLRQQIATINQTMSSESAAETESAARPPRTP